MAVCIVIIFCAMSATTPARLEAAGSNICACAFIDDAGVAGVGAAHWLGCGGRRSVATGAIGSGAAGAARAAATCAIDAYVGGTGAADCAACVGTWP
jgi:hypothetical protein